MPDETASPESRHDLEAELKESSESAAHLLESLAKKIGANRAVRNATTGVQRAAHYVQAHNMKDVASGIERLVRRRPGYSIAAAVMAGYLVGRALRRR